MSNDPVEEFYSVLNERDEGKEDTLDLVDLLKRAKEKLGLSQRQLSKALSLNRRTVQRILNREAKKIDLDTFQKLQQFLGMSPKELLDIYNSGLEADQLRELERARKAGYISRSFDLDGLKREGFIDSDRDFDEIEERVERFFDLTSVFEYDKDTDIPMFSRTRRDFSNKMLRFWVNSALHQIRLIDNPNPFDRDMLTRLIPSLRGLTRDEDSGLLRAARSLYSAGITVVIQSYLTGTQIRGGTFVVDDRPAIVLTDFNKRYDTIWFALLHELYHVLKDLDRIEKLGYHLTGDKGDLFVSQMSEKEANEFASEFLLPEDKRNYIRKFIDVPEVVRDYAEKWNIHPGIIYGLYTYEHGGHEKYLKYVPSPDKAVDSLRVHPWDKETLSAATKPLKEVYETSS